MITTLWQYQTRHQTVIFKFLRHHYPNLKQKLKIKEIVNIHVIFYVGNDFEGLINLDEACPSEKINDVKFGKKNLIDKLNYIINKYSIRIFICLRFQKFYTKIILMKKNIVILTQLSYIFLITVMIHFIVI